MVIRSSVSEEEEEGGGVGGSLSLSSWDIGLGRWCRCQCVCVCCPLPPGTENYHKRWWDCKIGWTYYCTWSCLFSLLLRYTGNCARLRCWRDKHGRRKRRCGADHLNLKRTLITDATTDDRPFDDQVSRRRRRRRERLRRKQRKRWRWSSFGNGSKTRKKQWKLSGQESLILSASASSSADIKVVFVDDDDQRSALSYDHQQWLHLRLPVSRPSCISGLTTLDDDDDSDYRSTFRLSSPSSAAMYFSSQCGHPRGGLGLGRSVSYCYCSVGTRMRCRNLVKQTSSLHFFLFSVSFLSRGSIVAVLEDDCLQFGGGGGGGWRLPAFRLHKHGATREKLLLLPCAICKCWVNC